MTFRMIEEGMITFENLKYLFKVTDKVIGKQDKLKLGGIIKTIHRQDTEYIFKVDTDVICTNGETVYFALHSFYIFNIMSFIVGFIIITLMEFIYLQIL